jgi:hypothetical protein
MDIAVEDQGAGGLDLAHRQLPPVPGVPVGRIQGQRDLRHPPAEPGLHVTGAEAVADPLQQGRVLAGGEPVGQRGEPQAELAGLLLGPLVPVHPRLDGIGEVGADLDEPGAHLGVEDVHVEHRDPALFPGEGELRAPARVGVAPARRPHQLEFLCAADRRDLRPAGRRGGLQVRGHHVGLALPGLEPDHRDAAGLRPVPDVAAELLPDRLEQRRGDDRLAPVVVEEPDHSARSLQLGDIADQVDPVQAGDVQPDMTGHHVRGSHHLRPGRQPGTAAFITLRTRIHDLRMIPQSASCRQNYRTWRSEAEPLWSFCCFPDSGRKARTVASWPASGPLALRQGHGQVRRRNQHGQA